MLNVWDLLYYLSLLLLGLPFGLWPLLINLPNTVAGACFLFTRIV